MFKIAVIRHFTFTQNPRILKCYFALEFHVNTLLKARFNLDTHAWMRETIDKIYVYEA